MGSRTNGRGLVVAFSTRARAHVRANIVGYLALFVALGGTTYAATGGTFILGKSNSASSKTSLAARISDKALALTSEAPASAARNAIRRCRMDQHSAAGQPALSRARPRV